MSIMIINNLVVLYVCIMVSFPKAWRRATSRSTIISSFFQSFNFQLFIPFRNHASYRYLTESSADYFLSSRAARVLERKTLNHLIATGLRAVRGKPVSLKNAFLFHESAFPKSIGGSINQSFSAREARCTPREISNASS